MLETTVYCGYRIMVITPVFQTGDRGSIPLTRSYNFMASKKQEGVAIEKILKNLGLKPSISEEHGLSLIGPEDESIFSPGISTGGFAEIRMAKQNPKRKIIATTIDKEGLDFAQKIIANLNLSNQIETRFEDLREPENYQPGSFDFIYARLVLHYLSFQDLNKVLKDFYKILKENGKLFVVVRSTRNIPNRDDITFDQKTQITSIPRYDSDGNISHIERRYFHTLESIGGHLEGAGFTINKKREYQEQLYKDFARKEPAPKMDHVIEVCASKSPL